MQDITQTADVLIVGAGPSGLMMACQLTLWGISYRIIDKKELGTSCSGALILQARSLEILEQLGIADSAIKEGIIAEKIRASFNCNMPISLNVKNIGVGLTKFPYLLMLEQSKTEKLLENYISTFGIFVERKTELVSFSQDLGFVTSVIKLPNGIQETLKTKYLIGADGGRSFVREQLNIPFLGKTHELALFVLDAKAEVDLLANEIYFSFTRNASTGMFPLKDGRWRIDGTLPHNIKRNEDVTFQHVNKWFDDRTPLTIELSEPDWFSVFHSHQRFAAAFRQNRCFLIGDAAHIFSPVGAQGMNSSIQDAYNLAWKLALVIKNEASESLLETYHSERQALAKKIVHSTDRAFHMVSSGSRIAKFFRLRCLPLLLKILFPIIEKNSLFGQFLFKRISEIGISYHKHFSIKKFSNGRFSMRAPKPGDRLPFVKFRHNGLDTSTHEHLEPTSFHLLVFTKRPDRSDYEVWAEKFEFLSLEVIPYSEETASLFKRFGIRKEGCYLIRPDMYIAYRSKWMDARVEKYLDNYLK